MENKYRAGKVLHVEDVDIISHKLRNTNPNANPNPNLTGALKDRKCVNEIMVLTPSTDFIS